MARYEIICVATLLIVLTQECHSQLHVCGQAPLNTKIVGGQTASPGSWPWQVSLQLSGSHFCGGSLISDQWVLTAAHCTTWISTSSLNVSLGLQSQGGSNPNQQTRTVEQNIVHPDYDDFTNDNDIALLKLSTPVNFTNYVLPVCLAASGSTFYNGTNSWVTGWGTTASGASAISQTLMEVEVPVVGNRQCNCDYGVGSITNNMMCAGLRAGGKDSCQGDSGGPMVSKQGGRWIQSGIVSFGDGCALPNFPGVYTRVSQYQTWINSQISSNQPGFITYTSTGTDGDLSVSCAGLPPVTTTTTASTTTTTTTTTTPSTSTITSLSTTSTSAHDASTSSTTFTSAASSIPTSLSSTSLFATSTSTPSSSANPPSTISTTSYQSVFCGQAALNTRILGANSTSGLWPWMVSLQRNGSHVCGGTLVAVDSVLSSADCFSSSSNASDWIAVLGRLKQFGSNPNEVSLNVTNITLSNLTGSNVAVLRLASRPSLSDYIQPICLGNTQTFAVGSTCWAAGWSSGRGGVEQVLQETQATVVDCGNLSTSDICTEFIALDQGDSGGPIMCQQDGSWFQAAVLPLTTNNSSTRTKAARVMVFTKMSVYEKFLIQTLGTFLSPASNNASTNTTTTTNATPPTTVMTTRGGTSAHSHFFYLHVFILCLTCLFFLL